MKITPESAAAGRADNPAAKRANHLKASFGISNPQPAKKVYPQP
jgi:hypothetical protein